MLFKCLLYILICKCICLFLSSFVVCSFFATLLLLLTATISFCLVGCSVSMLVSIFGFVLSVYYGFVSVFWFQILLRIHVTIDICFLWLQSYYCIFTFVQVFFHSCLFSSFMCLVNINQSVGIYLFLRIMEWWFVYTFVTF